MVYESIVGESWLTIYVQLDHLINREFHGIIPLIFAMYKFACSATDVEKDTCATCVLPHTFFLLVDL